MPPLIAAFGFVVPAMLAGVALLAVFEPGIRPRGVLRAARAATASAFLVALVIAGLVSWYGPETSPNFGFRGICLSVRLDALSAVSLLLVSFVGVIVVQFSRNYLDGDARQGMFTGGLCLTLAAVCLLVLSGNLFQLVVGWIATSLALHRLLVFYRGRHAAVIAARKKFVTARVGDICLIAAAIALSNAFGTSDIATLLARARTLDPVAVPSGVVSATILIAVAALLKSAQFPSHGWLTEVMETPTPVSALLHAGIINAGGFLVIRFADVMLLAPWSLHLLALVGGFTALFGSVVMLTQPSVKVSLAWSTVAQMGFMLLECGLGAFAIAVLHIVAHSLYKAHAFLSSGSVVDIARTAWLPDLKPGPGPAEASCALVIALAAYGSIGAPFGLFAREPFAVLALGAILIMGLTLLIAQSFRGGARFSVACRSIGAVCGATCAYFVLQSGATWLMSPTLPAIPAQDGFGIAIIALAVVSFGAVTVLQLLVPFWADTPIGRTARVHLANGLYANCVFNRMVGAMKRPAPKLASGGQQA